MHDDDLGAFYPAAREHFILLGVKSFGTLFRDPIDILSIPICPNNGFTPFFIQAVRSLNLLRCELFSP